MKRKLLFTFLLIEVIFISGCAGNVKTVPQASPQVTHLDTLEFALDPPVSEELLDAINFTDAKSKNIIASNEGWRITSKNKGSLERGKGDTLNSSERERLRQEHINLTKTGRFNYTEPNIFIASSPSFFLVRQFCDSNRIYGIIDNSAINRVTLALKDYNCSMSAKVTLISIDVPESAYIINKETLAYMKNKGFVLQYYQADENEHYYAIAFSESNISLSTTITQIKESYTNYTTEDLDTDNKIYEEFIIENRTFKNGIYWSLNVSNMLSNRAKWYCSANNSTVEVRSDAPKLLLFDEMTELSKYLCPE